MALGYRGDIIKSYFLNFRTSNSDISVDLASGQTIVHDNDRPAWKVHLVDTGLHTQTGGAAEAPAQVAGSRRGVLFTYGDGVADIDITALLEFHESHGKLATVTTVRFAGPIRPHRVQGDRVTGSTKSRRRVMGGSTGDSSC